MTVAGIAAKITSRETIDYVRNVARDLRGRGLTVLFDRMTAKALGEQSAVERSEMGSRADVLITFGGDGTLLSVARHAPSHVPIIGVNMGTLGFLTEIRVEEFPDILEQVLAKTHQTEARVALDVTVHDNGRVTHYRVLNDAVINKSALARIVEMRVEVSGHFLTNFRADGLIISTPTGSTAYNLSAGGPILYPTMGAVVVTPICPHMLTNRPIVLPDDSIIKVGIVTEHKETFLTLDGQEGVPIDERKTITIRKSAHTVQLVQSPEKDYFDVLRTKLRWGEGS